MGTSSEFRANRGLGCVARHIGDLPRNTICLARIGSHMGVLWSSNDRSNNIQNTTHRGQVADRVAYASPQQRNVWYKKEIGISLTPMHFKT